MLADVALHFVLDMSGAVSLACLLKVCNNPLHNHGRLVTWVGNHVWVTQSLLALVVAYFTVRLIG